MGIIRILEQALETLAVEVLIVEGHDHHRDQRHTRANRLVQVPLAQLPGIGARKLPPPRLARDRIATDLALDSEGKGFGVLRQGDVVQFGDRLQFG